MHYLKRMVIELREQAPENLVEIESYHPRGKFGHSTGIKFNAIRQLKLLQRLSVDLMGTLYFNISLLLPEPLIVSI